MGEITKLFEYTFEVIENIFYRDIKSGHVIVSMLIVCLLMALYEFIVYRLISHRSLYNKSFQILIILVPIFMGSIILSQQTNSVLTLGTIGALAIIRFRTVIKDPVDMLYLLWSVFIGLCCGCQLYLICLTTSILVTLILVTVNIVDGKLIRKSYCLVINCDIDCEDKINGVISKYTKYSRLKSRSYTSNGINYLFEIVIKDVKELIEDIKTIKEIKKFSLLEYDSEDII